MALHHPGPSPTLALLHRHLPRPHFPSPHIPPAPPFLPLPHPFWPIRGQPRDMPEYQRTSRGDVAAAWGIRTALVAIRAFMDSEVGGQVGGLECSVEGRRDLAGWSREWKCRECEGG
ncbi:hypothetical protein BGX38DRAFT_418616 [Terfezia claveryi]|nr:hypothetical protein BGX38DRAFT_418616 [Terfezia claveryi]